MTQKTLLDKEQTNFLDKRRALIKTWRIAGTVSLLALLGFIIWLWLSNPLLINPFATIAAIESGSMSDTTLVVMAAMLPVIFLLTLFLILLLLVLVSASLGHEKRFIAMIESLLASAEDVASK